jgi:hypothetical protein
LARCRGDRQPIDAASTFDQQEFHHILKAHEQSQAQHSPHLIASDKSLTRRKTPRLPTATNKSFKEVIRSIGKDAFTSDLNSFRCFVLQRAGRHWKGLLPS